MRLAPLVRGALRNLAPPDIVKTMTRSTATALATALAVPDHLRA